MATANLLILTTGGTIAGQVAGGTATAAHEKQGGFQTVLKSTVDEIQEAWGVRLALHSVEIANVDSSDIAPEHWTKLANEIHAQYDEYDGFVVTHGTNTMGYTCAALSFALPNIFKPVVVTGSQVPHGKPGSDAQINLENAIRIAAYPYVPIRGVVCVFGSRIIPGTRAKKETEFDLDAIKSFQAGDLGQIGRIMQPNRANLQRHEDYQSRTASPALMKRDLRVEADFDTRLLSLTEFPGLKPELLKSILEPAIERDDEAAIRGVVFRAFGAGDVSHRLHPVFELLRHGEIPVVVTTQAPRGNSNFLVNDPGLTLRDNDLAIPAYDMSIEAITTKLAWLLAKNTEYRAMKTEMHRDLHGEVNVVAAEAA
jgi:L-asparaginase